MSLLYKVLSLLTQIVKVWSRGLQNRYDCLKLAQLLEQNIKVNFRKQSSVTPIGEISWYLNSWLQFRRNLDVSFQNFSCQNYNNSLVSYAVLSYYDMETNILLCYGRINTIKFSVLKTWIIRVALKILRVISQSLYHLIDCSIYSQQDSRTCMHTLTVINEKKV